MPKAFMIYLASELIIHNPVDLVTITANHANIHNNVNGVVG